MSRARVVVSILAVHLVHLVHVVHTPAAAAALDSFDDTGAWSVRASPGATAEIAQDQGASGMALRLDFDFRGGGGYVIVRRDLAMQLPSNFAFRLDVRGQAPRNTFEMKLVDARTDDVWWARQVDFPFPLDWQQLTLKKSRFQFAWGASGGGSPSRIGAIELAIVAGQGGTGSVWFDNLQVEQREPAARNGRKPRVLASTSSLGHEPSAVLDPDPKTIWRSGSVAEQQWLLFDFGKPREYGGLVIEWDPEDYAADYDVQVSGDAQSYTTVSGVRSGNGGRDYVDLHDGESRYLRLDLRRSSRGQGYAVRAVEVKSGTFSDTPNAFFQSIARESPSGWFPKYFSGRQTYWTIIGAGGDGKVALLNEEGALEIAPGSFSLEPFLYSDCELITWSDVTTTTSLQNGYLPIPSVTWVHPKLRLVVTAIAAGEVGAATTHIRYAVENRTDAPQDVSLFVAVRPFQVLPPWQDLNLRGGVAPVRTLAGDGRSVWIGDDHTVTAVTLPDRFGAAPFEEGLLTDFIGHGKLPANWKVSDEFGYATGALEYRLALAPHGRSEVMLSAPMQAGTTVSMPTTGVAPGEASAWFAAELERSLHRWEAKLGRVEWVVLESGRDMIDAVRTATAHVLINRDGPALHPGARTYARAWIRDGADISRALLATGFHYEVREFLGWFARFQFPDGRIPCCIDRRGADQVPEYDSNGEFLSTLGDYHRFSRDVGFVFDLWPNVLRAVESIDNLRQQRRTDAYRAPDKLALFGLMPESISHEGYSARPVHSYWDDFWTLRGLRAAVDLAVALGEEDHARQFAALRDSFTEDLFASIPRAMARSRIDYVPGSVELGDFDATSTSAAILGGVEIAERFPEAVSRTYERYWENVRRRIEPPAPSGRKAMARPTEKPGDVGYTAYEFRNVEALVRLGQRERAWTLLSSLMADRRPLAWNQWQEITWLDPTVPRFIGDMPHTWIGAIFVSSVRSLFAYEDSTRQALVLGAGLPAEWLADPAGVGVRRLPTQFGALNYVVRPDGPNRQLWRLTGAISAPAGGIVLRPPMAAPPRAVTVNGAAVETDGREIVLREVPADVLLEW